jgi:multiple sugar transport system permease protein
MAEPIGARRTLSWAVIDTLVVLYALVPVLWILSLSLKPTSAVRDGKFIPSSITFDNYRGIFQHNFFSSALLNSIGIGLITTVIAVVIGAMAAYAVARLTFPGKAALIGAALLIAMFPQISLVTPLFNIERAVGLFDTWPGLILPYITFALPLAIYTLSAFFREIPWDLEKAAKMDGATPAQAFRKVIAPLATPGIVTAAILVFIVDRDQGVDHCAGGYREFHRQFAIRGADRIDRGRRYGDHRPDHRLCSNFPTANRRRVDFRRGEGVARWPRLCWTRSPRATPTVRWPCRNSASRLPTASS